MGIAAWLFNLRVCCSNTRVLDSCKVDTTESPPEPEETKPTGFKGLAPQISNLREESMGQVSQPFGSICICQSVWNITGTSCIDKSSVLKQSLLSLQSKMTRTLGQSVRRHLLAFGTLRSFAKAPHLDCQLKASAAISGCFSFDTGFRSFVSSALSWWSKSGEASLVSDTSQWDCRAGILSFPCVLENFHGAFL